MQQNEPIRVSTHVARDFLQNAAYFSTAPKIVWEYVSNSLDNSREGAQSVVAVRISNESISISDNGLGMSRENLRNFFQMHGENIQRKRGKKVRGRFGTGKCAAFGLANSLEIQTVQGHLRNVVSLSRQDVEGARSGEPFPVRDLEVNVPTDEDDGTEVTIRDFNVKRLDIDGVISHLEKHLSRYRQRAIVTVNEHVCRITELPFLEHYESTPPPEVANHLGNVVLTVKVSPVPLDKESGGIDILSEGIWHETTLAGCEGRERADYLFGEVDVPVLESGDWPIPAFDNTRNNSLNRQNPVVVVLLGWIASELEPIRKRLVEAERERRKSREAEALAREADRIASILNEDFEELEMELELARRVARRPGNRPSLEGSSPSGQPWPGDGKEVTPWEHTGQEHNDGIRGSSPPGGGDTARPGPTARPGSSTGTTKDFEGTEKKHRRAIFSIDFQPEAATNPRSRYDRKTKTIIINLDHPQIAGAFKAGGERTDSRQFREICYEIAVVEYAIAISYEKLERDEYYPTGDALFDLRDTINRVTQRIAQALQET